MSMTTFNAAVAGYSSDGLTAGTVSQGDADLLKLLDEHHNLARGVRRIAYHHGLHTGLISAGTDIEAVDWQAIIAQLIPVILAILQVVAKFI